jgi:hypothetical protein
MTKETYESRINQLDEADSDCSFQRYRRSAESIADDADQEIKNLKELLITCEIILEAADGYKSMAQAIREALDE